MSPLSKEQFEAMREESRASILNAALKLFSKRGFENTSISDIAREAEISKGLMYNYFKSKDELLVQTLQMILEKVILVFIPASKISEPDKRLEFLIRTNFDLLKKDPGFWKMFVTLSLQLDKRSKAYSIISNYWGQLFENAIKIFTEMGVENPHATAFRYGALMDGLAMQYLLLGEEKFPQFETTLENVIKEFCTPKNKTK